MCGQDADAPTGLMERGHDLPALAIGVGRRTSPHRCGDVPIGRGDQAAIPLLLFKGHPRPAGHRGCHTERGAGHCVESLRSAGPSLCQHECLLHPGVRCTSIPLLVRLVTVSK